MSLKSFLPPNANLFLAQMDCRIVCAVLQEALGSSSYSPHKKLFFRDRLTLLALRHAERFSFQNLVRRTPKVSLFVHLNPYGR